MGDESHIPMIMNSGPVNKAHSQICSTLRGAGREMDGAETSSRAMHEVRRSILRKLAPHFHSVNSLSSFTE